MQNIDQNFISGIKGARCVCVYGGTGISEQIAELKRGAEIIAISAIQFFS